MKSFGSIGDFTAFLAGVAERLPAAKRAGLDAGAAIIIAETDREIGNYQPAEGQFPGWPQLAASTLRDKRRLGFSPPDNPLLRTGAMRESIQREIISDDEAIVGSPDQVAKWQELGTEQDGEEHIPARSFLARAAFRRAPEVAEAVGRGVFTVFTDQIPMKVETPDNG